MGLKAEPITFAVIGAMLIGLLLIILSVTKTIAWIIGMILFLSGGVALTVLLVPKRTNI